MCQASSFHTSEAIRGRRLQVRCFLSDIRANVHRETACSRIVEGDVLKALQSVGEAPAAYWACCWSIGSRLALLYCR